MTLKTSVAMFLLITFSATASAELIGRMPGTGSTYQAYYDTELDVTWLTDTIYDVSLLGLTPWQYSVDEVSTALSQHTILDAFGWRLPTIEELDHMVLVNGVSGYAPGPFQGILPPNPPESWDFPRWFSSTPYEAEPGMVWLYDLSHGYRDVALGTFPKNVLGSVFR